MKADVSVCKIENDEDDTTTPSGIQLSEEEEYREDFPESEDKPDTFISITDVLCDKDDAEEIYSLPPHRQWFVLISFFSRIKSNLVFLLFLALATC